MPLATPAQIRALALPALSGGADDPLIAQQITIADAQIAAALGLPAATAGAAPTLASTTYTLYTGALEDLDLSDDGQEIRSPAWPITAITSIHDDPDEAYGADTLVSSSDYALSSNAKAIRLRPTSTRGAWSEGERAVKVVFVAGWTALPPDLLEALALQVQHQLSQRAGIQEQIDGAGVRIVTQRRAIPREVEKILDRRQDLRWSIR